MLKAEKVLKTRLQCEFTTTNARWVFRIEFTLVEIIVGLLMCLDLNRQSNKLLVSEKNKSNNNQNAQLRLSIIQQMKSLGIIDCSHDNTLKLGPTPFSGWWRLQTCSILSKKEGFLLFSRRPVFHVSVRKLVPPWQESRKLIERSFAPFLDLLVWRKSRQVHFRLLQRSTTTGRVESGWLEIFWKSY